MSSWKRWATVAATGAMICATAGLVIVSAALVRGSDDYYTEDDQHQAAAEQQQAPQQDQQQEQAPQSKSRQAADGIKLQGKGEQESEKFTLEPGLSVFEVTHDGSSNLVIRLMDEDGELIDTIFNQIGAFTGDRGYEVERSGDCLLDVIADGNWTVAIRQPRDNQGKQTPTTLQGSGQHTTPFVQLGEGPVVFKLKHEGEARFRVTLIDENGREIEQIADELGAFDGSMPVKIDNAGIYFLNVNADGDWTIDVE